MTDNWFEKLFINEAKAALLNRGGSGGGGSGGGGSAVLKELTVTVNGEYTPPKTAKFKDVLTSADFPESVMTEEYADLWDTENNGAILMNQAGVGFVLAISYKNGTDVYYYVSSVEIASMIGSFSEAGWYKMASYYEPPAPCDTPEMKVTPDLTDIIQNYASLFAEITKPDGFNKVMVEVPTFEEENTTLKEKNAAFEEKINRMALIASKTVTELTAEDFEHITEIGPYWYYKDELYLESVTIPGHIKKIGTEAFCYCAKLKRVHVNCSGSVHFGAFRHCYRLTDVVIECNEGASGEIGKNMFERCTDLSNVTIKEGIRHIGEYAFEGCSSLIDITIPASVQTIGQYAMSIDTKIIRMLGTIPPTLDYAAIRSTYVEQIIVPVGCGDAYKSAEKWSNCADIIVEEGAV